MTNLSTLTPTEKRALLANLLAQKNQLPLSFAQQRLWFLDRLNPDRCNYNLVFGVKMTGSLDVSALKAALNAIVRRHETLRTSFTVVEGRPVQVVAANLSLDLPVVSLQHLDTSERSREIDRLAAVATDRVFDLGKAPLLTATLLQLSQREWVLLLAMHHIISDAWSIALLISEVGTLYTAFIAGKPSPLPELKLQYAYFALWQRQQLAKGNFDPQLAYWQQQLADRPSVLQLPTDRPRPPVPSLKGATQAIELPADLRDAIASLSREAGTTLFMTLLAAFQVLLYRYSSQTDICVGSPIANRHRTETNGIIGFFINTLVLRSDLSGNPSFWDLLQQVKERCLSAYANQDLPFEYLVEKLQPERDLSHNPLFQVSFALQNVREGSLDLPGLEVDYLKLETRSANFDLSFDLYETESGIAGAIEYSTDLFDAETISRMAGHYRNLLSEIVANPRNCISQFALLDGEEKAWLLGMGQFESQKSKVVGAQSVAEGWSRSLPPAMEARPLQKLEGREWGEDLCIHELFERRVQEQPDAIALTFEERQLTYRELDERANNLAIELQNLGVAPETLVGLCVERSFDLIIGILGILKAGGAYVPLDPSYPAERLAFMVSDAQVSIIVTQSHLIQTLPPHNALTVCIDTLETAIAEDKVSNPPLCVSPSPQNLAYVIYTSGSTGKPKGVLIPHRNVIRLLTATQGWFEFSSKDTWTLFHSYAFDFSVWEIWGALLYGGRLAIVPYWVSRSPQAFYELLCREKVTVLNQTPSAFQQLMAVAGEGLKLRSVIFGGEALEIASLKPWFDRFGDEMPQLVNMYGITETTVHVTYRPLKIADLQRRGSAIGYPIPDLQVYILDPYLQLVPIGVPGEIYVGGAGLARGYLNRPDLDAQRFIANPFGEGRLYKTGDLARYLPNGELEYLGRIDNQVKIRGFRIELGEIEAILGSHPAIERVAVLMREDRPGDCPKRAARSDRQLVVYLVSSGDRSPTSGELRAFLKQQLPDYMVPSSFVCLPCFPLTNNGKLDRRALPAPDSARPELESDFIEPKTETEQILAEIWGQVLGIERIGTADNFFALGGDSIRSIQVQFQARSRGLHFTLQELFQHQTIGTLAANLADTGTDVDAIAPFALISASDRAKLPEGAVDAYPLTPLQMGMLFHSEYSADDSLYHNVSSIHLQCPFDGEKLRVAVQDLISRHPVLRTSFDLASYQQPLQLVWEGVEIPFEITDLHHLSSQEQDEILSAWFEAEKKRRFVYEIAPLLRFHVHRRTEETFQFTFVEHHAILDGWSLASAISELFEHYLHLIDKEVGAIAPAPVSQFRDFVALQNEAAKSLECREFWQNKLKNSYITALPRWGMKSESSSTDLVEVAIAPSVSQGLKQLGDRLGVPLRSVLLAAHLEVLKAVSQSQEVLTGVSSNGRPETLDGERCLGLFLNTLPFRLKLHASSWSEAIKQTFAAERELMPFRRYPSAQIQQDCGGKKLYETSFNFTNFHVYQRLQKSGDIEVLDWQTFAVTDLVLLANFSFDAVACQIYLDLEWDGNELCSAQIRDLASYYNYVLGAMAIAPQGYWDEPEAIAMQQHTKTLQEVQKQTVKDRQINRLKSIERKAVRGHRA